MENSTITLNEYLEKAKPFIIPYYQRGYVWGKSRGVQRDSVSFLLESIKNAYENGVELFLQGVTVSEGNEKIELIDGQQRTTALYLFLQYLQYTGVFAIEYSIRTQSQDFLNSIKGKSVQEIVQACIENQDEQFQDIYYFKKTVRTVDAEFKYICREEDRQKMLQFLLEKIKFLYIDISSEKATTIFSMMNGNRAEMKYEEIIKAEMLRLVSKEEDVNSLDLHEREAQRWEQNLLRSKYAREWDKWLYWWNRKDVMMFYRTKNVMGLLVETYYYAKKNRELKFNFENFRDSLLRAKNNTLQAKKVFYELRQLQKKFEDVFNSINNGDKLHNKVGAILTLLNSDDCKKFIRLFFANQKSLNIDEYLKLVYLGLEHSQILKELFAGSDGKADLKSEIEKQELLKIIENNELYNLNEGKEQAFRQLLRRNIEEDTKLGRIFDFSIFQRGERSLEHILPQSKVYYQEDGVSYSCKDNSKVSPDCSFVNRADLDKLGCSQHCIGNMVLLYKNENSGFGNKDFIQKKAVYFNLNGDAVFRSRHLLHSISVFAIEKWGAKEIQENKQNIIEEIKQYYEI